MDESTEQSSPRADQSPALIVSDPMHSVIATSPIDPWSHRRGEPRTFVAAWILMLLGSVVIVLGSVGATGLVSTDVYRPAAQRLVLLIGVCASVLWPMIRLSQEPPERVRAAFLADAMIVLGSSMVIVLPQSLPWMADWPVEVVLCAAAWLGAWVMLISGVLSWHFSRARGTTARWAVMLALVIGAVGAPVVLGLLRGGQDTDGLSPEPSSMLSALGGLAEITRDRAWSGQSAKVYPAHWWGVASASGSAMLAWIIATHALARERARGG